MKKLSLLLMAFFTVIAANAWTVKFTNPDNWAKVYVYTFALETEGKWPGSEMTKDGDLWVYEGTGEPTKIIFNNNAGSQTGNLDFVADATYDKDGILGAEKTEYTVYFDNSKSNWSEVYAYGFNGVVTPAWPGVKLTANSEGLYVFSFEATSEPTDAKIIFNNGSGDQTDNLDYVAGATYDKDGKVEGGEEPNPPTPGNDYEGWYVNLGGDFITGYWRGMAVPADGKVSFDGLAIGTNEFKLKVWNGTADAYYTTAGHVVATDVATAMTESTENDCAITITGATEGALYDVTFDCATSTITVVNHEGEIVVTYALRGTITTGDAENWVDLEMTEDAEGNWSWSGTVVPGDFGIKKMENGAQTAWYSSADAATINGSGNYSAMVNGTNWTSELEGDAAFTFNPRLSFLLHQVQLQLRL